MNVAPGSTLRGFYEKAPIGIDFRVIIFNVTNKDDVVRGSEFLAKFLSFVGNILVEISNQIAYFHIAHE